ncbi:MAG: hypothetical protein EOP08_06080, partial [Proteobacteria bacterium]
MPKPTRPPTRAGCPDSALAPGDARGTRRRWPPSRRPDRRAGGAPDRRSPGLPRRGGRPVRSRCPLRRGRGAEPRASAHPSDRRPRTARRTGA